LTDTAVVKPSDTRTKKPTARFFIIFVAKVGNKETFRKRREQRMSHEKNASSTTERRIQTTHLF